MRDCVGDHPRACVAMVLYLSYNRIPIRWRSKGNPQAVSKSRVLCFCVKRFLIRFALIFNFTIFRLHSLTNRVAVHFEESESTLCLVSVNQFAVYTSAF